MLWMAENSNPQMAMRNTGCVPVLELHSAACTHRTLMAHALSTTPDVQAASCQSLHGCLLAAIRVGPMLQDETGITSCCHDTHGPTIPHRLPSYLAHDHAPHHPSSFEIDGCTLAPAGRL